MNHREREEQLTHVLEYAGGHRILYTDGGTAMGTSSKVIGNRQDRASLWISVYWKLFLAD